MTGSIPPPNPLSYEGQVVVPFIQRTFNPQTTFNKFPVPTIWINSSAGNAYILVSKELGVADWVMIGGTPGVLDTITTPDSTIVVPTAGNINFLNGTGFNITGSGSNITFSANAMTITAGTGLSGGGSLNLGGTITLSLTTPVTIANGGTSKTSFTAYSVICGGTTTTGALQSVASLGTSGQVLTSNGAAALPTWQTNAGGNVSGPGSSTDRAIATWNGTSGTTLFNNSTATIDSSGRMLNTAQPAFLAIPADAVDVTGNSFALYQYGTSAMTEIFDQGGDFNTNGTFTAPVTGKYNFSGAGYLQGCTINNTCALRLITSNRSYQTSSVRPASNLASTTVFSLLADMDIADTATMSIAGSGEAANTDDLLGTSGGITLSYFSGHLEC